MPATFEYAVAAATLLLFAVIALREVRRVKSPRDYFHDSRLRPAVWSYAAANISLGTGLAYALSGGQQLGFWMLLPPAGLLAGYLTLAWLCSRMGQSTLKAPDVLRGFAEEIAQDTGRASILAPTLVLSLSLVFSIALAFELFISSRLLCSVLLGQSGLWWTLCTSWVVFAFVLVWCTASGIRGVYATDRLQLIGTFVLVILVLVVAVSTGFTRTPPALQLDDHSALPSWAVIGAVASAAVMAFATQFYNILNWGAISQIEERVAVARMLRRVGIVTFTAILGIVIAGATYRPDGAALGDPLSSLLSDYHAARANSRALSWILPVFVLPGLLAVLFSTLDSLVINTTRFIYDLFPGRSSKSELGSDEKADGLRKARQLTVAVYAVVFIMLTAMHFLTPNYFRLLLSVFAGAPAFAPLLAAILFLQQRGRSLAVFSNKIIAIYGAIFVVGTCVGWTALAAGKPWAERVGLWVFCVSLVFSLFLGIIAHGRRKPVTSGGL
ncbi:MAG: hypothetical protein KAY37_07925 [Phycisphaerae bacterium]|nr:hypothetical protein [Phycisphaerae bacterium]